MTVALIITPELSLSSKVPGAAEPSLPELLAAKALNARVDAGAQNELPDRPIDEGGES